MKSYKVRLLFGRLLLSNKLGLCFWCGILRVLFPLRHPRKLQSGYSIPNRLSLQSQSYWLRYPNPIAPYWRLILCLIPFHLRGIGLQLHTRPPRNLALLIPLLESVRLQCNQFVYSKLWFNYSKLFQ
jgi:hypothetical protein